MNVIDGCVAGMCGNAWIDCVKSWKGNCPNLFMPHVEMLEYLDGIFNACE